MRSRVEAKPRSVEFAEVKWDEVVVGEREWGVVDRLCANRCGSTVQVQNKGKAKSMVAEQTLGGRWGRMSVGEVVGTSPVVGHTARRVELKVNWNLQSFKYETATVC